MRRGSYDTGRVLWVDSGFRCPEQNIETGCCDLWEGPKDRGTGSLPGWVWGPTVVCHHGSSPNGTGWCVVFCVLEVLSVGVGTGLPRRQGPGVERDAWGVWG